MFVLSLLIFSLRLFWSPSATLINLLNSLIIFSLSFFRSLVASLKVLSINHNEISISYEKNRINIEEIINLIKKNNIKISDISTDDGDLEDVFLVQTKS